ncbi:MAG TPA: YXWGXW repeat-containing protein [Bryobacteraceae bacterium]|nr:YXWGXW repeat-containing protein [Bryobacteraceae bacterium]
MKTKLLALTLLAAGCVFGQVSIGVRIGPPPPPRVVRVVPSRPGPDYVWIDGYWYVVNGRYVWHAGYWTLPPYPGARWIAPRHDGQQFFAGYWDGDRGRFEHDHRWDRDRDRDRGRWRDHDDHDRGRDHDDHDRR